MIIKIRGKKGSSLSEEELCAELNEQAERVAVDIGIQPFALVRRAFLEKAAQKDEIFFDELLASANPGLDVISLASI